MIVLHSTSQCDICLEPYTCSGSYDTPYGISCGHIFCYRCLLSLGSAICPLCRKPFALERCMKLHVDLPPITQDDKVAGFLRRLASAVTEDAPLDTALDNMQDILKWLNSQPPKSNELLRSAWYIFTKYQTLKCSLVTKVLAVEDKWSIKVAKAQSETSALQSEIARLRRSSDVATRDHNGRSADRTKHERDQSRVQIRVVKGKEREGSFDTRDRAAHAIPPNHDHGASSKHIRPVSSSGKLNRASTSQMKAITMREEQVADIIEKAKEDAERKARGASAWTTIKYAQAQLEKARNFEDIDNPRKALDALTQAKKLLEIFQSSDEYIAENKPGGHGLLYAMFKDLSSREGNHILHRASAMRYKLVQIGFEQEATTRSNIHGREADRNNLNGSIADRLRSLQENGLIVNNSPHRRRQ